MYQIQATVADPSLLAKSRSIFHNPDTDGAKTLVYPLSWQALDHRDEIPRHLRHP